MNKVITIANREIGYDYNPLVIAEIGINHGGDLGLAKRLIDSAAKTGCDAVKFQTYITEKIHFSMNKLILLVFSNLFSMYKLTYCLFNECTESL